MPALIITEGKQKGLFLPLGHSTAVVGRDPAIALQIEDQLASRKHCQVRFDETRNGYVLTDMKSANGTRINDRVITGETVLNDDDEITIGSTKLLFTMSTPADGPSAMEVLKSARERHHSTIASPTRR
ncbi:MAG TPA: FHA domain-containing protein [Phycisphaerales bacterium]|nr:FHA domain-containing protein [Phycisphaerales bacterium]